MWRRTKQSRWEPVLVALLLVGQIFFNGPAPVIKADGPAPVIKAAGSPVNPSVELTASGTASRPGTPPPSRKPSASANSAYWINCVNLARQQATLSQKPEPPALDACYLTLLAKYGIKLLSDISSNPPNFFEGLQQMQMQHQQPSIVQWFIHLGTTGYSSVQEKQELISVAEAVDQDKIDPNAVKGYNARVDKPLFNQFVKQRLPTLSSQSLDQWLTRAILAIPTAIKPACNIPLPPYSPSPLVDSPDSSHTGNLSYLGGRVIDGTANVYLIYWVDNSSQAFGPKYESLTEQFVQDFSQSPLYANLSQYHDILGRCPTGARLAGTFVDNRPFPPNVVAERNDPNVTGDQLHTDIDKTARQEIADVAAKQDWNTRDYHNLYGILLPIVDSKPGGCGGGAHNWLHTSDGQQGSPFMFLPYSCGFLVSSPNQDSNAQDAPNQDIDADNMVDTMSHELSEAISDPYVDGWTGNGGEMADKCVDNVSFHINPQTHGNVIWNGHTYAIQQEYSNFHHGCVLEGP